MEYIIVRERALLLDCLVMSLARYKRGNIKAFLKFGSVFVNDKPVKRHDHHLSPGDRISVYTTTREGNAAQRRYRLRVVYEDDDLLVIDKPAGLLTIATEAERTKTAYRELTEYARATTTVGRGRVFVVHRLDRETSGLIVFAKSETVKHQLQERWSETEKRYLAVVEGVPADASGTIESELTEDRSLRVRSGPKTAYSRTAITKYKILQAGRHYSLLEVYPLTGRKNQIRVHMADIGHSIAGDRKYGGRSDPAGRLALHASYLAFMHPVTGEKMVFDSPLPDVLRPVPGFDREGGLDKGKGPTYHRAR